MLSTGCVLLEMVPSFAGGSKVSGLPWSFTVTNNFAIWPVEKLICPGSDSCFLLAFTDNSYCWPVFAVLGT